jgi:peptidoglycan/xylan/chitin deacetylase (PgdA/CDA1 family)
MNPMTKLLFATRLSMRFLSLAFFAMVTVLQSAAAAEEPEPLRNIYLYKSPATGAFFKANDGDYNNLLAHWRLYLKKYGELSREVTRADLTSSLPPGVLVLASALLLDDDERRAVEDFTRRGGSVLATWATGARDGNGNWKGYGFLTDIFDVKIAGEIRREEGQWFMMPFGDGPITWPLPAGRRMYLGRVAENLLRVDARFVAARYMDWNRAPDFRLPDGAIAYSERQGARRVYLGFAESAWDYHTREDVNQMLDAMIAWLRREPRLFKAAWPNGKVAAQLLEMDTEAMFQNAANFARHLDEAGIKGTFYCLTSEAIKFPDLVRSLMQRGHEIAYHADIHIGFQNQKPEQQEQRMLNMLGQMSKIVGPNLAPHTGFRAPTESYDQTTEILLRKHGMKHHAADPSSTEDRLPFFSKSEKSLGTDEALVVLPRTNYDDISFRMAGMSNARVEQHLVRDFEHVYEMGAFGLLSVHSQNYGQDGPMMLAMPVLFKRIAEAGNAVWLARGDQVAEWWRQRERVTVSARNEGGAHLLQVNVRAPGVGSGVSVMVIHAQAGHPPTRIETLTPYSPSAEIRPVDAFRSAVVLGSAAPGSYRFRLRF